MINKLKYLKLNDVLDRIDNLKSAGYTHELTETKNKNYQRIYVSFGSKKVATISIFKNHFNTVTYVKSHDCTKLKFALHGEDVTIVVNSKYSDKLKYGAYGCIILSENSNKGVGGLFKTKMMSSLECSIASVCNSLKRAYNWNLIENGQSVVVKLDNLQVVTLFTKFDITKFKRFQKYVEYIDKFKAENNIQLFFSYFDPRCPTEKMKRHILNANTVSDQYFKRGYNGAVQTNTGERLGVI
ncbi:hypothetical protein [Vibrio phage vB_VibM_83AMN]|nr:hypothetical protein [Vibrio phage vB_VibM_83AMN]